jgi:hypothetical protein
VNPLDRLVLVSSFREELEKISRVAKGVKMYRRALQQRLKGSHLYHGTGSSLPAVAESGSLRAVKDPQGQKAVSLSSSPWMGTSYWNKSTGVAVPKARVPNRHADLGGERVVPGHVKSKTSVPVEGGKSYVFTGPGSDAEEVAAARKMQRMRKVRPMNLAIHESAEKPARMSGRGRRYEGPTKKELYRLLKGTKGTLEGFGW